MKKTVIGTCPICASDMKVTQISCENCDTVIKNEFELSKFDKLTKEQKYFAEMFIIHAGNIKTLEKRLGISYPTVKRFLNELIQALGHTVKKEDKKSKKMEVLEKLEKGEMTPEEAINKINNL